MKLITSLFPLALIGLVVYLIIKFFNRLGKQFEQKTDKQFHILGQLHHLDLSFTENPFHATKWNAPELKGTIEGYDCHIYNTENPNGNGTDYYTNIEFTFNNHLDIAFELYLNDINAKVFYGKTDLDFNDKKFEKYFAIRTTFKYLAKDVFDQELRKTLVKNRKHFLYMSKLKVKSNKITILLHSKMFNNKYRKQIENMLYLIPKIIKKI